ncbi:hypothetical protein PVAND_008874 [Polypedilum vanderplanki]|uniref:Gustatory receptor n=1 Tax=Polypedilum vanderplanki TaxID=319348 RepID=A0A9J6CBQ4_POLVA|nr:hypothetical protein PVAND_008874 [Polypedilum vanderplanki]
MENFYTVMKPLCTFGNFLGFFHFSFDSDVRKGNLVFNKIDLLQNIAAIGVLCIIMIANIIQYDLYLYEKDFFEYRVWSWMIYFAIPSILLMIVFQMTKNKKIKKFFNVMASCDEKIYNLNLIIDHRKHKKVVVWLSLLSIFTPVINYIKVLSGDDLEFNTIVQEFFYAYYMLYECFIFIQFIIPTYLIRERFKVLQCFLKKTNINDKSPNIKIFTDIFHELCDSIERINVIYAIHLIPILLLMIISDIFCIYAIARHLILNKTTSDTMISVNSFYFITHSIMKSAIAHIGHTTTLEGEEVRTLVAKITNDAPCKDLSTSIFHNILIQFQTRNLKMKNIFFNVDWRVVLATTSTIVTYLVITCQFQSPSLSN